MLFDGQKSIFVGQCYFGYVIFPRYSILHEPAFLIKDVLKQNSIELVPVQVYKLEIFH